jgi:hypothetical protein
MQVGELQSNLLYWNGADLGGNGLTLDDVQFSAATGVKWEVRDDASASYFADGSDQFIPGGRIGTTSSDTNLGDDIDTGLLHKHLALSLSSTVEGGTPAAGIYAIAWQARSAGFEKSAPFVFVHRTSTVTDSARNLAAEWIEQNLDMLFSSLLPGDYNDDGLVDASDYTVWRDAFGSTIALPNENASLNIVDAADYDVWKAKFGTSIESGARALADVRVPEPTTLALALFAETVPPMLLSGRRRQLVTHLD